MASNGSFQKAWRLGRKGTIAPDAKDGARQLVGTVFCSLNHGIPSASHSQRLKRCHCVLPHCIRAPLFAASTSTRLVVPPAGRDLDAARLFHLIGKPRGRIQGDPIFHQSGIDGPV